MDTVPANPFASSGPDHELRIWVPIEWVESVERALDTVTSALIVAGPARMGKGPMVEAAIAARRGLGELVAGVDLATAAGPEDGVERLEESVRRALSVPPGETAGRRAEPGAIGVTAGVGARGDDLQQLVDALIAADSQVSRLGVRLGLAVVGCERLMAWGGSDGAARVQTAASGLASIGTVLVGSTPWRDFRRPPADGAPQSLRCEPIASPAIADWIRDAADATGVPLDPAGVDAIVALAGPRTADIVLLARAVWDAADAEGEGASDAAGVARCLDQLVAEQAPLHARYWHSLAPTAQRVLRLLVEAPEVALTSAATLVQYRLGPKSTVHLAARRLVDDGILVDADDVAGASAEGAPRGESRGRDGVGARDRGRDRARLAFDDPYFRRWVERFVVATHV